MTPDGWTNIPSRQWEAPAASEIIAVDSAANYRYLLEYERTEGNGERLVVIELNPSTAGLLNGLGQFICDPTAGKVRTVAGRWGFSRVTLLNLFALRETDPIELSRKVGRFDNELVAGEENLDLLREETTDPRATVAVAWGSKLKGAQTQFEEQVKIVLAHLRCRLFAVKNANGSPRHGLRWNREPILELWRDAM